MAVENIKIEVNDEELDAAIEKLNRALEGTVKVEEAVTKVLAKKKSTDTEVDLKALEARLKSILAQVPELRVLTTMLTQLERFAGAKGQLMASLLAVPFILNMINQMRMDIAQMKQNQLNYERMIREARGFTSHEQFLMWETDYYRQLELAKRGDSPL